MADYSDMVVATLGLTAMPLPDDVMSNVDVNPPLLAISPSGGTLQSDGVITIEASDDQVIAIVTIYSGDRVIYTGEHFTPEYASSTLTTLSGGVRLEVRRGEGWLEGPVPIESMVIDKGGNLKRVIALFEGTLVLEQPPYVKTVFGRGGPHVVAKIGDYTASQVLNTSAVPGTSVAEAQGALAADVATRAQLAADLSGSPASPVVAKIQGRPVLDTNPASGDVLTWSALNQRWEPKPPPAPPATFWSVLYDKDLRTLDDQAVSASMSNTFINFTADGQPWCFHSCTASLMIVKGQGMVGVVSGDAVGGNGYAGLHVSMKIYQMAGYDVAKETAVQVRFSNMASGAAIGGASVWCSPSEQWGYGPGDEVALERWYEAPYYLSRFGGPGSTGADAYQAVQGVAEYYSTLVFAVSQMPTARTNPAASNGKTNYRAGYFKRGALPDVWPSMESMTPNGGNTGRTDINVNALKMGWYAGSTSGNKTITATHIRVLQRPVT